MPRPQKIWYWKARKEWCVKINKIRQRLGPDKAEAERKFHELMAHPEKPVDPESVAALIDKFLDWTQKNREPRTYEWYQMHLQSFLDSLTPKTLTVGGLKPHHVHTWADARDWGPTFRRGAMTAVCRAFNWAEELGHIAASPLRKLKKPRAKTREQVLTPKEYATVLTFVKGAFRDLVVTIWETGCRPFEATRLEARHVDLDTGRWVFPEEEAKGRIRNRVIYMTDTVLKIVQRLVEKYPAGPIFRNQDGTPWTGYSINNAFRRLQVDMGKQAAGKIEIPKAAIAAKMEAMRKRREKKGKQGLPESKLRSQATASLTDAIARRHAPKYCFYAFRHSFITNGLKNGVDPVTMANLVGHVDLRMIHGVYSHISQDQEFMRKAATKAVR